MADTSSYSPPSRPFLQPPSPNTIPSAEEAGLTGADAWAYGVSARLMSDPGRWDLFNQVQSGMVWLDEYMKEIEDRLHSSKDEEDIDFVELVKTPGRNRVHPQSHFHGVSNAEKLAKINALHFGEAEPPSKTISMEKAQVKTKQPVVIIKTQPLEQPQQQPRTPDVLPASSTNHTIRPVMGTKADDTHVISRPSIMPAPVVVPETRYNLTTTMTAQTTQITTHSNHSTASISSASGTSRASVTGGAERRFGPRPLPAVPPTGVRSRAASNVSMMGSCVQPPHVPKTPSSRAANATVTQSKAMDLVDHQPTQQPQVVPAPNVTAPSVSHPKLAPTSAPRTLSPAEAESDDMEVEVEVPLNDATVTLSLQINKATTASTTVAPIFPTPDSLSLSRKPSFASLPVPSPLRKSMRGLATGTSDITGHIIKSLSTTPHSRSSSAVTSSNNSHKARSSVAAGAGGQRTSGWFKNIGAPAATTSHLPSGTSAKKGLKSLVTDEKTALNTAANAALGAVPTSAVVQVPGHGRAGSTNSLKRKSEAIDIVEFASTGVADSAGEERASKAVKKAGKSFAMEKDPEEADREEGEDNDDTAERLLKLRGVLKGAGVVDEPDKSRPRVDSRPQSRSEFQSVSRTGTSTSVTSEKSVKTPVTANAAGTLRISPLKVSELVGAWEGKKNAVDDTSPMGKKPTEKKDGGFGIPKFLAQGKSGMSALHGINLMAASTTPPGSPLLRAAVAKLDATEQVAGSKLSGGDGSQTSNPAAAPKHTVTASEGGPSIAVPIFKPTTAWNTSIFSAPTPKATPQPQPPQVKIIFTRPPSQQYGTSQQSQSTADDDTDPLFEPARNKGRTSASTFDTMSQPSQEPSAAKGDLSERPGEWDLEEEGLTTGWPSKGNDILGENEASLRGLQVPGADNGDDDQYQEEEEESDRAFAEDDDMTNLHQAETQYAAGEERFDQEEMVVDSQEDPEPDFEQEEGKKEEDEEDVEPAPTPVATGLFAQVGSLASKAASGLKSLRMAAAAAEKEKTEREKKEARLKEMDARRQAALQKKAEGESKRKDEVERKRKLEEERRKKEKADTTLNRTAKPLVPPTEKRQPELKRGPSKLGLSNSVLGVSKVGQPPTTSKRAPTPTKVPTIKLVGQPNPSSAAAALHSAPSSALASILGPSVNKAGAKVTFKANSSIALKTNLMGMGNGSTTNLVGGKQIEVETVETDVSTTLDTRVRVSEGGIDESADLPDIKSEYSDSEDEDRPKTYNPPGWAQSPDLRQALEGMRTVNPDTIFGAMPQLRMEEIFPGRRKSKFRARTSSANWAGTDGVTAEEEDEYARIMGFES